MKKIYGSFFLLALIIAFPCGELRADVLKPRNSDNRFDSLFDVSIGDLPAKYDLNFFTTGKLDEYQKSLNPELDGFDVLRVRVLPLKKTVVMIAATREFDSRRNCKSAAARERKEMEKRFGATFSKTKSDSDEYRALSSSGMERDISCVDQTLKLVIRSDTAVQDSVRESRERVAPVHCDTTAAPPFRQVPDYSTSFPGVKKIPLKEIQVSLGNVASRVEELYNQVLDRGIECLENSVVSYSIVLDPSGRPADITLLSTNVLASGFLKLASEEIQRETFPAQSESGYRSATFRLRMQVPTNDTPFRVNVINDTDQCVVGIFETPCSDVASYVEGTLHIPRERRIYIGVKDYIKGYSKLDQALIDKIIAAFKDRGYARVDRATIVITTTTVKPPAE